MFAFLVATYKAVFIATPLALDEKQEQKLATTNCVSIFMYTSLPSVLNLAKPKKGGKVKRIQVKRKRLKIY